MSDRDWQDESIEKRIDARKREFRFPSFMPFFWLGLAGIAGPLVSDQIGLGWYWWAGLACLGLMSLFLNRRKTPAVQTVRSLPVGLVLLFFSLTAMLYQLRLPQDGQNQLTWYHQKGKITLTGVVSAPPETRPTSLEVVVRAEKVVFNGVARPVGGKVLFYLPLGSRIAYGDRLEIRGEFEKPQEGENFRWREYLEHKGIRSTTRYPQIKVIESGQGHPILSLLYRTRERGNAVLTQIFPAPEDALLRGILLGDESGISPKLEDAYRRTGTSHIIAISGFNMAVLAGLVSLFFTRYFGTKRGALATIILLLAYSFLVGGSAPVLRAAFMGAFAVIAGVIARKGNTLNSLGLSAVVLVLIDPHLPWDIGFQFSFLSTLGLVLFAGPIQLRVTDWFTARFEERKGTILASAISEFLLLTLIAQAMVLPLSIWHFHQVSWLFLLANPLVLPIQPAVMILGLLAMSGGMLSLPLGRALAWLALPWAALTNFLVSTIAQIPARSLVLREFNLFWVGICYMLLFLLMFKSKIKAISKAILYPQYLLLGLAAITTVVWWIGIKAPDGKLHLYLPQGDKQNFVFIQGAQGQSILIAGSAGEESLARMISAKMPLFQSELDLVLIPDCRRYQITGLFQVIEKYKIDRVLWMCDPEQNQTSRNLYARLEERQSSQTRVTAELELQSSDLNLTLNTRQGSMVDLRLEHEAVLLAIRDRTENGSPPPIASTALSGDPVYSVQAGCENCLVENPLGAVGKTKIKSGLNWQELTSDGHFLYIHIP